MDIHGEFHKDVKFSTVSRGAITRAGDRDGRPYRIREKQSGTNLIGGGAALLLVTQGAWENRNSPNKNPHRMACTSGGGGKRSAREAGAQSFYRLVPAENHRSDFSPIKLHPAPASPRRLFQSRRCWHRRPGCPRGRSGRRRPRRHHRCPS